MLIGLAITLILIAVLFVFLFNSYKKEPKPDAKPVLYVPRAGKVVPIYRKNRLPCIYMIICAALFVCNLIAIIIFANRTQATEPEPTIPPTISLSETPELTPTPTAFSPAEESDFSRAHRVVWLDELKPQTDCSENFNIGVWDDQTPFLIGQRKYKHGIGMQICASAIETVVDNGDFPNGIYRHDCKQASITYALRFNYSKMVFSLGVDASNMQYFGPKEINGQGRVIIADTSYQIRSVLSDTEWKDYAYSAYEIELSLEKVDLLEITVMTCGYGENRVTDGLRFAIVDPILYLKDGS